MQLPCHMRQAIAPQINSLVREGVDAAIIQLVGCVDFALDEFQEVLGYPFRLWLKF